ncbi:hypothetical protein HYX70_02660 [Candidatus Saccharibacteria bacterium]|nr:hypothetical protein [Candidatus Saccharibacteria bacterium]
MWKYLRFKLRRKSRRMYYHLHLWRIWLLNYFSRHIYGGWQKLGSMRSVMVAWLGLVLICYWGLLVGIQNLDARYVATVPAYGGNYSEGLTGELRSMNPIFADNSASKDISALIFSGLTKIDPSGGYAGDLANNWDVSPDKKSYTFYLRSNAKWQDGRPVTAEDIAFTVSVIQNPDTRSPYSADWKGVQAEVLNSSTVRFNLPASYSEFLYTTTVGILPKHILANVKPSLLKLHEFNQRPIGSGPYRYVGGSANSGVVRLQAFSEFYMGRPYIPTMQMYIYPTERDQITAYERKEIMGISQIEPPDYQTLSKIENLKLYQLKQPAYVAVFFNLKNSKLTKPLRQALAYATNRDTIVSGVLYSQGVRSQLPLPAGFSGFTADTTRYDYSQDLARSSLATAKAQDTTLNLVTLKGSVYQQVAESLKKQWQAIGVNLNINAVDATSLQQDYVRPRNYDLLLYGQNLGAGSDEYSFWHSSQVDDPGLNLSSYKNSNVDRDLEAGRIAKDPAYKASKYTDFLKLWSQDEPAIILYNPYYDYAQSVVLKGFNTTRIIEPQNRFNNVYKWYINTRPALKARQ